MDHYAPSTMRVALALALFSLISSCNGQKPSATGTSNVPEAGQLCEDGSTLLGCGEACTEATGCRIGLYCSKAGTCTADCASNSDCRDGRLCQTAVGACVTELSRGDTTPECASFSLSGDKVTPNIVLLIDQSGSMDDPFPATVCTGSNTPVQGCRASCSSNNPCPAGFYCSANNNGRCQMDCDDTTYLCATGYTCQSNGRCRDSATNTKRGTRWNVLRDILTDATTGIIQEMQSLAQMGVSFYTGTTDDDAMCPALQSVPMVLNNYAAINSVYQTLSPENETPTGDAITELVAQLKADPQLAGRPTTIILATDGEPDTCEQPNPQQGQGEAVAAAKAAQAAGIPLFVISVGTDVSQNHLQDMANAGVGHQAGMPDAPFWVATDSTGLRDAIFGIAKNALTCTIKLEGEADMSMPCLGSVKLNGVDLVCNGPDGWKLVDPSHIQLQGAACETVKNTENPSLDVTFPCIQKNG